MATAPYMPLSSKVYTFYSIYLIDMDWAIDGDAWHPIIESTYDFTFYYTDLRNKQMS